MLRRLVNICIPLKIWEFRLRQRFPDGVQKTHFERCVFSVCEGRGGVRQKLHHPMIGFMTLRVAFLLNSPSSCFVEHGSFCVLAVVVKGNLEICCVRLILASAIC